MFQPAKALHINVSSLFPAHISVKHSVKLIKVCFHKAFTDLVADRISYLTHSNTVSVVFLLIEFTGSQFVQLFSQGGYECSC